MYVSTPVCEYECVYVCPQVRGRGLYMMYAILHQSSHRVYGSVRSGNPLTTRRGKQPPAAPMATYSVIFGVETKSPAEVREACGEQRGCG